MPGLDDFYMAYARQQQRERQREAERVRLARAAKRAARQRAARETRENLADAPPTPPARHSGRRTTPGLLRLSRRVAAVRRAAGYALLEVGLRLLTPPSRRSQVAAGPVDSMSGRSPESP